MIFTSHFSQFPMQSMSCQPQHVAISLRTAAPSRSQALLVRCLLCAFMSARTTVWNQLTRHQAAREFTVDLKIKVKRCECFPDHPKLQFWNCRGRFYSSEMITGVILLRGHQDRCRGLIDTLQGHYYSSEQRKCFRSGSRWIRVGNVQPTL